MSFFHPSVEMQSHPWNLSVQGNQSPPGVHERAISALFYTLLCPTLPGLQQVWDAVGNRNQQNISSLLFPVTFSPGKAFLRFPFPDSPGLGCTDTEALSSPGPRDGMEQTAGNNPSPCARTQLCACPSAFKELLPHKSILWDFRGVKPKAILELKIILQKKLKLSVVL